MNVVIGCLNSLSKRPTICLFKFLPACLPAAASAKVCLHSAPATFTGTSATKVSNYQSSKMFTRATSNGGCLS
jgi:hypothetical protein